MDLFTAIILCILLTVTVYFYNFYIKENIFDKHGIPYIKPWPLLGNMAPSLFQRIALVYYIQKVYNLNKNAKYVGFFDFGSPTIIIRDPELIKTMAIKNFDHFVNHRGFVDAKVEPLLSCNLFSLHDDEWRQMRSLLSPLFTTSKMKGMLKLMSNCAEIYADYFTEQTQKNPLEINSKDLFSRACNDVIATCAFGISINSMKDRNNDFYIFGKDSTNLEGILGVKLFVLRSFPTLAKLLGIQLFDSRVNEFFTKIIKDTIRTRDEKGITRPDLIQLMMESRNSKTGPNLSINDMASQAFSFFFGGFETISSLLCFIAHEVAANFEIQTKLQNEIDEMFEKFNGDVTYEAVNKLQYLDAVINESLRYYPNAGFLDRVCSKSFELPPTLPGEKSLRLEPGDYIWFPVFPLQRDPKYFHDADKFNPDRFVNDNKGQFQLISFGLGPRICIGYRFALLEIKVMLVHLIAKCKLKVGKKMITPLKISNKSFAMTAKGGFWLELEPRNK